MLPESLKPEWNAHSEEEGVLSEQPNLGMLEYTTFLRQTGRRYWKA